MIPRSHSWPSVDLLLQKLDPANNTVGRVREGQLNASGDYHSLLTTRGGLIWQFCCGWSSIYEWVSCAWLLIGEDIRRVIQSVCPEFCGSRMSMKPTSRMGAIFKAASKINRGAVTTTRSLNMQWGSSESRGGFLG